MSCIGKNIKKIRTVKNLSQAAFAQLFDLARPSVGAYEEGRSEPKIDTLIQIARHFGVSLDLLITKELTVNDLYGFDIFKRDLHQNQLLIKVADAEEAPVLRAALVMASEQDNYFVRRQEREFLDNLPTLLLPGQQQVLHRAFEHTGSEMQYQQHGLRHGDLLYCTTLPVDASQLKPNEVYVVVTANKLITRRFQGLTDEGALLLKADNPDYDHLLQPLEEVTEFWHVDGFYSTYLKSPSSLEERLTKLESLVKKLMGE
ncbi:XRE family transcriptional regulator [Rufibacter quisquiliarum]|uniref:Transcriptional regulator with XRE-family HTH domain n=1 Tax=Rufibacter quisquiliarum TaxID=1549639 RepID=A0A839GXK2_9BACT|nr:helix-turn-helix domain-containing protein [Rufibacter quisquiliarum]MBA9079168.1 transcriptional regulator with XRE-family HTH domain [Rufibacter quisquiliarum]